LKPFCAQDLWKGALTSFEFDASSARHGTSRPVTPFCPNWTIIFIAAPQFFTFSIAMEI
jgi:hypothetical protein